MLDTETTGLEPADGHRVVEIGCIELIERRRTDRQFHCYLNPEREVEGGALTVHGITDEFLADKPKFADIAERLLAFIEGAELIIHNAPFDVGFLNAELARIDRTPPIRIEQVADVLDTLALARELHPGQRVSLDALCKRYEIDHSGRQLHGALLDAELLAEVYLAMTGGQVDLALELRPSGALSLEACGDALVDRSGLVVMTATAQELALHRKRLEAIRKQAGHCLWQELDAD